VEFDLIILGGGLNGLGTARDAALRGLRVLVLEKGDLGGGASGSGSGWLRGGPRAFAAGAGPGDDPLAAGEAGVLEAIAPHLVSRVPFLRPFASRDEGDALASGAPRLGAEALAALEPGLSPGLLGALAHDDRAVDGPRLCVANARSARDHGAEVRPWTEAREVVRQDGRVVGVRWLDALTGESGLARAPAVLDATGAWAPGLARRNGLALRLRPGKGVHLVLAGRLTTHALAFGAVDGRALFLAPRGGETWLGATEGGFYGDPDDVEATQDEVAYLLEGAAALLPAVREARATRAVAGPRASRFEWGPGEEALSRGHALLDHAAEGAAGLLSLVGGQLSTARAQAEAATDAVLRALGRPAVACRTREVALPGGETPADAAALAAAHGIAPLVAARLVARQGALAGEVLRLADDDPRLGLLLCREEGILAAEVVHACRHELVRRLRDLRTRCRLAVGGCGGLDCARAAAQLAGRELGWDAERVRAELADLLEVGWRERRAVLDGAQLAQEELLRGAHWGVGR